MAHPACLTLLNSLFKNEVLGIFRAKRGALMKTSNLIVSFCVLFILTFALPTFAEINLNTASQSKLESLPGVGKKLASAIIEKRPFTNVDELKHLKGVSDSKFETIKTLVYVSEPEEPSAQTNSRPIALARNPRASAKSSTGGRVRRSSEAEKLPGIRIKKAETIQTPPVMRSSL